MKKLQGAHNDAFRILLKLHVMFVINDVPTFYAVLRNFMRKLTDLKNVIIKSLTEPTLSDTSYFSCYCKYPKKCL